MADTTALKNRIRAAIKANDNQEITGPVLQQTLLDIVDELDLNPELQEAINTEKNARQTADTQLNEAINTEKNARQTADTQLSDLITGIKNNIDNGYVYAGIATPSTTPVSGKVFYVAVQAGTYTNLGGTVVIEGITILKYNGTSWVKEQILFTDGGVFDISAYHATGGELAKYANLNAALGTNGANIPEPLRKGGMSIKFVQSSDNNYKQFRCIADEFTTDVTMWQGSSILDQNGIVGEKGDNEIIYFVDKNNYIIAAIIHGNLITTQINLLQALSSKQDTLTFDTTPTEGSLNPVTSGGLANILKYFLPYTVNNGTLYFTDEAGYCIASISSKGIKSINVLYANENSINDALLERKNIQTNYPYYLEYESNPQSFEGDAYLDRKIREVGKGKHFIFVTDTHWVDGNHKSNYIIDYVKKRLNIDTVIFGGDVLNGYESPTKYLAAEYISKYADEYYSAFGRGGLWVTGNHDGNIHGAAEPSDLLPDDELFKRTVRNIETVVTFDTKGMTDIQDAELSETNLRIAEGWMKLHYYYDDMINNTRFIVLETGNYGYTAANILSLGYGEVLSLQFNWLADTLMNTPSNFDVVICGHQLGDNSTGYSNGYYRGIGQIASAFKGKKTVGINMYPNGNSKSKMQTILCGTEQNKTFDFSNSQWNGKMFIIEGHYHVDFAIYAQYNENGTWNPKVNIGSDKLNNSAVLTIATTCDNYTKDTTISGRNDESTLGTIDEMAADIVTLTETGIVQCIRIGAGNNRMFNI